MMMSDQFLAKPVKKELVILSSTESEKAAVSEASREAIY